MHIDISTIAAIIIEFKRFKIKIEIIAKDAEFGEREITRIQAERIVEAVHKIENNEHFAQALEHYNDEERRD